MVGNESDDHKDIHELVADSFATELLIPEDSLKENVKEVTDNYAKVIDSEIDKFYTPGILPSN